MGLRIVNTIPGEVTDPVVPGQAIHFGLKSETLSAQPATLALNLGYTNLAHNSSFVPSANPTLTSEGTVTIETAEHQRPVTGTSSFAINGSGNLAITHSSNLDGETGVQELKISVPSDTQASVLAYVRLKVNRTWTQFNPNWCSANNTVGFYFGLEHGQLNSAAYMFLRNNGSNGSIVVGGPLQAYNTPRPAQTEYAFAWLSAFPDGSLIDLYIWFNVIDQRVEFWKKDPNDTTPTVLLGTIPISSLGSFQASSTHFDNTRIGVSDTVTLYLGNAGRSGDVIEVADFALYPDFRVAVRNGKAFPNHSLQFLPDAPVEFDAQNGLMPAQLTIGPWILISDASATIPITSSYYQPGRRYAPLYINITKTSAGIMGYQKKEPRIEPIAPVSSGDGFAIEAFVAGVDTETSALATNMGFGADDGQHSYRLMFLNNQTDKYVALQKDSSIPGDLLNGFYYEQDVSGNPVPFDYSTLKFIRLVVDRRRNKVLVFLQDEDTPAFIVPLSSTFPTSPTSYGRILFGHLQDLSTQGTFQVAQLRYVPRYLAWETTDNLIPSDAGIDAGVRFTYNIASTADLTQGVTGLTITKTGFNAVSSARYFTKAEPFSTIDGIQVDFRTQVLSYTGITGALRDPNTSVGAGVEIFTGTQKLYLGFYDAGVNGKIIGIIPGSGSQQDIINQTALGRQFSTPYDWTQMTTYRVVMKSYDSIKVYIGTPTGNPVITIPWRDEQSGFDLPLDTTTAGLVFGAVEDGPASTTTWQYIRWGMSNGLETAVRQLYPDGYQSYQFSGRMLATVDFSEG